ncbi:MAG: multicopper oxidase domain-containing protein [Rhodobacteraceae bacterium]|nr:multicopper oxidase domain-containing protein [Paracoccaceae bacterium]
MMTLSRRGFLVASAASAASLLIPARIRAATGPLTLRAETRVLDIDGRAATLWGLTNGSGTQGLTLAPGERFRVDLTNALAEPTLIHWHGQIPPNAQDGVPDMPAPKLLPGETRSYDYAALPGTYWMHAHIPLQELHLLTAPLIVHTAGDLAADRQEVVMTLHDFSFKTPEEVMAAITGAIPSGDDHSAGMAGQGMGTMGSGGGMAGGTMGGMSGMTGMSGMAMDLNDFDFDAYLANDRTLNDPEVVRVDKGGKVRLRVVNASTATVFWLDLGTLGGQLVAVDGTPVQPRTVSHFGLAMAQRADLLIDLPGPGAFPILALREGARERTGIILASPGAAVAKVAPLGADEAPAFSADLTQEAALRALTPLSNRPVDHAQMLMLAGAMSPYVWTIDGHTWADHVPVSVRSGERVELTFHNMSMMAHPMHLHGHKFQVFAINGRRFAGALRDTVHVPPMAAITIAFDAGEAARWMLHCHHMMHLQSGMMTELAISSAA